jgi:hypothetical protein
MRKKLEIKEKLEEAEKAFEKSADIDTDRLEGVVSALRWVIGVKIIQDPKDPVTDD